MLPIHGNEWSADAGARLFFESNIDCAAYSSDVLENFTFEPQISAGHYYFQLGEADGLTLAVNARRPFTGNTVG